MSSSLARIQDAGCYDLDSLPDILKVAEVARALRVDVKTIYGLIDRGELHATRVGPRRLIRVTKAVVLSYLQGGVTPTGEV